MRLDDDWANDIRETTGLVLNVAAVIAFVLCLNSFGTGNPGLAALVGIAAVTAFVASLLCFAGEQPADESKPTPLLSAFAPPTVDGLDLTPNAA